MATRPGPESDARGLRDPETDLEQLAPILGDHCRATGPAGSLTAHERMLLITDGNFTRLLEACVCRPIEAERLDDHSGPSDAATDRLFGRAGLKTVLRRRALLVDAETRRPFVFAQSWLDPAGFDAAFFDRMAASPLGLGRLIEALPCVSERELLGWRIDADDPCLRFFDEAAGREVLARIYRIRLDGVCRAVVTEKMPRALLRAAAAGKKPESAGRG